MKITVEASRPAVQVAAIFAPVVAIGRACTLRPPVVSGCNFGNKKQIEKAKIAVCIAVWLAVWTTKKHPGLRCFPLLEKAINFSYPFRRVNIRTCFPFAQFNSCICIGKPFCIEQFAKGRLRHFLPLWAINTIQEICKPG